MPRLFDTHAHLDDEQFDAIRDAVVQRARDAGVEGVVAVGCTIATSKKCAELAAQHDLVWAAVGIQPNYCAAAEPEDWGWVNWLVQRIKVVAIGETGLDRYWDYSPFALQQDYFDRHIRLSQGTGLPLVIHMRDCEADILAMLRDARRNGPITGVMHSFTGSAATAAECIDLGLYISFAGMVTYKKSEALREIAATIPDDRLLIETDSPYLSPHPERGRRPNEPALVAHTAACLAEVRGVDLEMLGQQTTENARRLFKVSGPYLPSPQYQAWNRSE